MTLTTDIWEQVQIADGAVLLSSTVIGLNTAKVFILSSASGRTDRVALYAPPSVGITTAGVQSNEVIEVCGACNTFSSYTVIMSNLLDPACADFMPMFTDGTGVIEETEEEMTDPDPPVVPDGGDEGGDEETPDNSTPEIQALIADFIELVPTPSGCAVNTVDQTSAAYTITTLIISCPDNPNRTFSVSYTDSADNWDLTVEHCGNVRTGVNSIGN